MKKYILLLSLLFCMIAAKAQTTIQGVVTNQESKPLSKVTVTVLGTSLSVTTDKDGNYQIKAEKGKDIVVFQLQAHTIVEKTAQDNLDVVLFAYQKDKTLKSIYKNAQNGDKYSQQQLANISYNGNNELPVNYREAQYWYTIAAGQGDNDSKKRLKNYCYYTGNQFENGNSIYDDIAMAIRWYQEGAENGEAPSQYKLGECYDIGKGVKKDLSQALNWYEKAAQQGYKDVAFTVAERYENGIGARQDWPKACQWYAKSAQNGNAEAQYQLANHYDRGIGVQKEFQTAVYWYQQAAAQNHVEAQVVLGKCYETGHGTPQQPEKAKDMYSKAAEQGNVFAQFFLGQCYEKGFGVEEEPVIALGWYTKSAENGFVDAQRRLADCYLNGYCVRGNIRKAASWYEKAAEQGDSYSAEKLKTLYDNYSVALEVDAEDGEPESQYRLGSCYYFGKGTSKNIEKALEWFNKAANSGNDKAQVVLGDFYFYGTDGMESDLETARFWYEKAAEQGNQDAIERLEDEVFEDGENEGEEDDD